MRKNRNHIISALLIALLIAAQALPITGAIYAQEPIGHARVYQDRVRFAAPDAAQERGVEVFGLDGNRRAGSRPLRRKRDCRQSLRYRGGRPGMKVSWQVTGVRQDAWANAHRIKVEEEKVGAERGSYLHPELFSQSTDKAVGQANATQKRAPSAKR